MASILIADDDPDIRALIRNMLESAGHTVTSAGDGAEADGLLVERPFDMLLADLLMPNRDGMELIIAARRRQPGLRIIAISGGGHLGADLYLNISRGLRVDGTLRKPFTRDELLAAVGSAQFACR